MSTGLMPVDEVTGFYDPSGKQLSLSARGSVQPNTSDIRFKRTQPSAGGSTSKALIFELIGTTAAIMGKKQPYNITQKESVALSSGMDVIVRTSNNPAGKAIVVYWGGLSRPDPDDLVIQAAATGFGALGDAKSAAATKVTPGL
jgi:hypothetical protein